MRLARDRAPGQDAAGRIENLARGIGIEIGRDHGADAALAEAPRRRGVGLRHFLEHLHEDFGRRLGATGALRQQHAIKPVLDQGGNHRLGETPGPLDLIGLPRDQRRQRSRALDQSETGKLVHAFFSPICGADRRSRNGDLFAVVDQDGARWEEYQRDQSLRNGRGKRMAAEPIGSAMTRSQNSLSYPPSARR